MIKRDKYLDQLIKGMDFPEYPKVITGIRRCGKSYLLTVLFKNYLLESGINNQNILIVDLDNDFYANLRNPIELSKYVRNYCADKNQKYFVIIDEVQSVFSLVNLSLTNGKYVLAKNTDTEIISFVDIVLGLSHESNIDLYITGSNSKMLSSDVVTQFRGKSINIDVKPLSFSEYYNMNSVDKSKALEEYMIYGGMPFAVLQDEEEKKKYLKSLFDTTYFKDIIERNKLKKSDSLDELCNILSECVGTLINKEKLANTYRSKTKQKIDKDTVNSYINYFVDSFLLKEAKRYDLKGKNEIGALRKYYFVDTGLRNARLNFAFADRGQMLENIVFNELIYNGFSVNVGCFNSFENDKNGKTIRKSYEIDMYAIRGNDQYYIQVCDKYIDDETIAREEAPFIKLNDGLQKIIVVNENINQTFNKNGYTIIGAVDFLTRFIVNKKY